MSIEKPLRADAQRNRKRVLEVAHAVFASEGIAVPIDEIARRAGFGVGTLYRHFPTKEALFGAVIIDHVERVLETARALATSSDPGHALLGCLIRIVEEGGVKRHLFDALAGAEFPEKARYEELKHELERTIEVLLVRAQKARAVRRDVDIDDVLALLTGAFAAVDRRAGDRLTNARLLALVFDGLRTSAVTTAPPPARAVRMGNRVRSAT